VEAAVAPAVRQLQQQLQKRRQDITEQDIELLAPQGVALEVCGNFPGNLINLQRLVTWLALLPVDD
jgi:intracellular sulfur oxidation DsrE/DsrF family protein